MERSLRLVLASALLDIFVLFALQAEESLPGQGSAPSPGSFVLVRTEGGGEFLGILLSASPERVELVDGEGRILTIYTPEVRELRLVEEKRFFNDAAENRLIVMPTAFPVGAGEVHVTSQEIVAVTLSAGLTPNLSLWGGISLPGALANLRWSVLLRDFGAASAGVFALTLWAEPNASVLLPYLIVSRGEAERSLSFAAALPVLFEPSESPSASSFLVALGGKRSISRSAALIGEGWFLFSDGASGFLDLFAAPAAVFRIASGRFSWDIGVVLPFRIGFDSGSPAAGGLMDGPVIPIPILSATYRLR